MSRVIDDGIVRLKFDSDRFNNAIRTSLQSISNLKNALALTRFKSISAIIKRTLSLEGFFSQVINLFIVSSYFLRFSCT